MHAESLFTNLAKNSIINTFRNPDCKRRPGFRLQNFPRRPPCSKPACSARISPPAAPTACTAMPNRMAVSFFARARALYPRLAAAGNLSMHRQNGNRCASKSFPIFLTKIFLCNPLFFSNKSAKIIKLYFFSYSQPDMLEWLSR